MLGGGLLEQYGPKASSGGGLLAKYGPSSLSDPSGFQINPPEHPDVRQRPIMFRGPQVSQPEVEPSAIDKIKAGSLFAADAAAKGFADIGEETARLVERGRQSIFKKVKETPEEKAENERRLAHPPSPFGMVEKMRQIADAKFKEGVIPQGTEGGFLQAGSEAVGGMIPGVAAAVAAPEVALPAMVGLGGLQSAGGGFNRVLQETGDIAKAGVAEAGEGAVGAAGSLVTLGALKGFPALQKLSQPTRAMMGTFFAAAENGIGGGTQAALNGIIEDRLTGDAKDQWSRAKERFLAAAGPSAFGGGVAHGIGGIAGMHGKPAVEGEPVPATDFERANTIKAGEPPAPAQEGAGAEVPAGRFPHQAGEQNLPQVPEAGKAGETTGPTEIDLGDRRAVERPGQPERRKAARPTIEQTNQEAALRALRKLNEGDTLGALGEMQGAAESQAAARKADKLTGLGNAQAFEESAREGRTETSADMDGLGYMNKLGHAFGDEALKKVGEAYKAEIDAYNATAEPGKQVEAFHPHGDEFALHGPSAEVNEQIQQRVNERLKNESVTGRIEDREDPNFGKNVTINGLGISWGHGEPGTGEVGAKDYYSPQAEKALLEHKAQREAAGERAKKGQAPPGAVFEDATPTEQPAPAESAGKEESTGLPLFKKPPQSKQAGAVDLFGQRKPNPEEVKPDKLGFYSPIEKALVEKMPNVADVEHVKNIAKQAQPREYEFSGLEDFLKGKQRVTKEDVRNYLRENNVKVEEVEAGGALQPGEYGEDRPQTKFDQYQTPGGSNYRELRLMMPRAGDAARNARLDAIENEMERLSGEYAQSQPQHVLRARGETSESLKIKAAGLRERMASLEVERARLKGEGLFKGGHFPEPNVLAHVRFNDRTDAQGRKTLFLEEVQSDWAAKGEREGFGVQPRFSVKDSHGNYRGDFSSREEAQSYLDNTPEHMREAVHGGDETPRIIETGATKGVPNMPFKTREQYAKLALRRMIRYAAEKGYDSISWTTGDMQAERYDLSKQIRTLNYRRNGDGDFELSFIDRNGHGHTLGKDIAPEKLADHVGKEVADKIIKGEGKDVNFAANNEPADMRKEFSGLDLKVGGEGMRAFYDKTLPKVANEIGKKWGAKAEKTNIGESAGLEGFDLKPEGSRWRLVRRDGEEVEGAPLFTSGRDAEDWVRKHESLEVHTLQIPPEMRESVMTKGQPRLGRMDLFGPRKPRGPESAAGENGRFDVPDETRRDKAYRAVVNDFERIVQLEKTAPNKVEGTDLEHALSLLPGKKFGDSEKLQKLAIDPLKAHMQEHGIPAIESTALKPSASDYLYAVHAKDMARFDEKQTGMTEADADAIIAKAGPEYTKIRDWNRALNEKRLDTLEGSGLISAEQRKAWEEKYGKDYVPLRTAKDPFEKLFGGKGLQVSGKESKARKGRSSKADSPLAFAVETMQTAIDRANANRVGRKLGELVEKNPQADLWRVETDANKIKEGEERLAFKENGEQRYIVTKDKGLAEGFKRITNPDPGAIKLLDPLLNYWHKVIIQYNPVFPLTNVPRDIGTAAIRHAIHGDLGAALSTAKNALPAAKGAFEAIRSEGKGGKWGEVYREARDAGALIGWREQFSYEDRIKDFEKALGPKNKAQALGQLMDDLNRATELGTRLATFKALRESGKSLDQAAMETRRITADFARRGSLAPIYRRLYLFSGANVQGISEAARSIKNNPGRASVVLGALVGSGLLNYQLSKVYGDDHELDKLNESDKARFFGVMVGKRRYGFAAPYTFSVFPYLGWKLGELMDGRTTKGKAMSDLVSQGIDAASPLPQGANLLQSVTPTVARPFMEIAQNKDFAGRPIAPTEDPFSKVQKPASQRFFQGVSPVAKEIAEGLHAGTGGTKVKPGAIEVSPEWIEHLAQAASGGLGSAVGRTQEVIRKLLTGQADDIRASDIPVVRPFVNEASRGSEGVLFRKNVEQIELNKAQQKAREPRDNPRALRLEPQADAAEKRIKALYDRMDRKGATDEQRAELQKQIDRIREQFNRRAKPILQGK